MFGINQFKFILNRVWFGMNLNWFIPNMLFSPCMLTAFFLHKLNTAIASRTFNERIASESCNHHMAQVSGDIIATVRPSRQP